MKKTAGIALAALAALLAGCTTALAFTVRRPPVLDTLGIKSVAVMPFETPLGGALYRQAASWLASEALSRIQATGQFVMVAPSQVERYRQLNENLADHVDALFSGKVTALSVQDTSREVERTDPKTKEKYTVTVYDRLVELEFEYYLTRTRDGAIIGPVRKSGSASASAENSRSSLSSPDSLVQRIVSRNISGLARDVAPYTVIERRRLERETSRDKAVKERAKAADALAREGSYKAAQDAYLALYQDSGSFAAAYNVCLLIAAQGDLEGAASFMQQVYSGTGNPKAAGELARLRREIENAGLAAAYSENQGRRERLAALMAGEIASRLPPLSRPAVISNSAQDRELADSAAQGIISGLLARNITVVDRSHQALVAAERAYQLSGLVSDDSLASLGREVGANVFVLVSVTGSYSTRRLQVRMLDIERGTILYQSPQTDEMNI